MHPWNNKKKATWTASGTCFRLSAPNLNLPAIGTSTFCLNPVRWGKKKGSSRPQISTPYNSQQACKYSRKKKKKKRLNNQAAQHKPFSRFSSRLVSLSRIRFPQLFNSNSNNPVVRSNPDTVQHSQTHPPSHNNKILLDPRLCHPFIHLSVSPSLLIAIGFLSLTSSSPLHWPQPRCFPLFFPPTHRPLFFTAAFSFLFCLLLYLSHFSAIWYSVFSALLMPISVVLLLFPLQFLSRTSYCPNNPDIIWWEDPSYHPEE